MTNEQNKDATVTVASQCTLSGARRVGPGSRTASTLPKWDGVPRVAAWLAESRVAINGGIVIARPLDDVQGSDVSKDAILAAEVTAAVPPGAELAYVFMRRPFEPRRTLVVVDVQRLAAQ